MDTSELDKQVSEISGDYLWPAGQSSVTRVYWQEHTVIDEMELGITYGSRRRLKFWFSNLDYRIPEAVEFRGGNKMCCLLVCFRRGEKRAPSDDR